MKGNKEPGAVTPGNDSQNLGFGFSGQLKNTAEYDSSARGFSPHRIPCLSCGARRGFAPLLDSDGSAGYCHSCRIYLRPRNSGERVRPSPRVTSRGKATSKVTESTTKQLVASYHYEDEAGILLYVVERFEWMETLEDGTTRKTKTFSQWRLGPDGGKLYGLGEIRRVLYELPGVLSAIRQGHQVWIVEGEKCADALNDRFRYELGDGDRATTAPGGSHGWRSEFAEVFRGANVVIWPDADEVGQRLGERIIADLQGVARSIRLVSAARLEEVLHGL